jgi:phospholipid/cholesterol/gamma-HCH transport system ATP-binding protein
MLYDEPTSGLDPVTAAEINELILQVREKYNTASIIITHDISCARQVSDRIVALINGESKLQGTFDELKAANDNDLKQFFNY